MQQRVDTLKKVLSKDLRALINRADRDDRKKRCDEDDADRDVSLGIDERKSKFAKDDDVATCCF